MSAFVVSVIRTKPVLLEGVDKHCTEVVATGFG